MLAPHHKQRTQVSGTPGLAHNSVHGTVYFGIQICLSIPCQLSGMPKKLLQAQKYWIWKQKVCANLCPSSLLTLGPVIHLSLVFFIGKRKIRLFSQRVSLNSAPGKCLISHDTFVAFWPMSFQVLEVSTPREVISLGLCFPSKNV